MNNERMTVLFYELLDWASMVINDNDEFVEFLRNHGFTEEEISEVGIGNN